MRSTSYSIYSTSRSNMCMDVAPLQTLEVRIHHIIISHTTWSDGCDYTQHK